jgi:hypothetical protein
VNHLSGRAGRGCRARRVRSRAFVPVRADRGASHRVGRDGETWLPLSSVGALTRPTRSLLARPRLDAVFDQRWGCACLLAIVSGTGSEQDGADERGAHTDTSRSDDAWVRCTTGVRHAGHLARTIAAALDPPPGVVAHRSLRRTPRSIAPTRRRGVGHGPRRRACSIPMMPLRSGRGAWTTHHARRRTRTVDCCRELSLDNVIAARRFAHRARTSDPRTPGVPAWVEWRRPRAPSPTP